MTKVKTTPALLAPIVVIARELWVLFTVPLAMITSFLGTGALTGAFVWWFFFSSEAEAAEEPEELQLEFEPGALVKLGKEKPEELEKEITEDLEVMEEAAEEAITKKEEPPPPEEKEKKDPPKIKPKQKAPDIKNPKAKESDVNSKKNTPYDDLPTVKQESADPFGDVNGWADMKKDGDPWATSVMSALNGMKIGSYAGKAKNGTYSFKLKVCKDGKVDKVYQNGSTGDSTLDNQIKAELERLKFKPIPANVAKGMKKNCSILRYTFKWSAGKVK